MTTIWTTVKVAKLKTRSQSSARKAIYEFRIELPLRAKIQVLAELVHAKFGIPLTFLRVIHRGHRLDLNQTVSQCQLSSGAVLYVHEVSGALLFPCRRFRNETDLPPMLEKFFWLNGMHLIVYQGNRYRDCERMDGVVRSTVESLSRKYCIDVDVQCRLDAPSTGDFSFDIAIKPFRLPTGALNIHETVASIIIRQTMKMIVMKKYLLACMNGQMVPRVAVFEFDTEITRICAFDFDERGVTFFKDYVHNQEIVELASLLSVSMDEEHYFEGCNGDQMVGTHEEDYLRLVQASEQFSAKISQLAEEYRQCILRQNSAVIKKAVDLFAANLEQLYEFQSSIHRLMSRLSLNDHPEEPRFVEPLCAPTRCPAPLTMLVSFVRNVNVTQPPISHAPFSVFHRVIHEDSTFNFPNSSNSYIYPMVQRPDTNHTAPEDLTLLEDPTARDDGVDPFPGVARPIAPLNGVFDLSGVVNRPCYLFRQPNGLPRRVTMLDLTCPTRSLLRVFESGTVEPWVHPQNPMPMMVFRQDFNGANVDPQVNQDLRQMRSINLHNIGAMGGPHGVLVFDALSLDHAREISSSEIQLRRSSRIAIPLTAEQVQQLPTVMANVGDTPISPLHIARALIQPQVPRLTAPRSPMLQARGAIRFPSPPVAQYFHNYPQPQFRVQHHHYVVDPSQPQNFQAVNVPMRLVASPQLQPAQQYGLQRSPRPVGPFNATLQPAVARNIPFFQPNMTPRPLSVRSPGAPAVPHMPNHQAIHPQLQQFQNRPVLQMHSNGPARYLYRPPIPTSHQRRRGRSENGTNNPVEEIPVQVSIQQDPENPGHARMELSQFARAPIHDDDEDGDVIMPYEPLTSQYLASRPRAKADIDDQEVVNTLPVTSNIFEDYLGDNVFEAPTTQHLTQILRQGLRIMVFGNTGRQVASKEAFAMIPKESHAPTDNIEIIKRYICLLRVQDLEYIQRSFANRRLLINEGFLGYLSMLIVMAADVETLRRAVQDVSALNDFYHPLRAAVARFSDNARFPETVELRRKLAKQWSGFTAHRSVMAQAPFRHESNGINCLNVLTAMSEQAIFDFLEILAQPRTEDFIGALVQVAVSFMNRIVVICYMSTGYSHGFREFVRRYFLARRQRNYAFDCFLDFVTRFWFIIVERDDVNKNAKEPSLISEFLHFPLSDSASSPNTSSTSEGIGPNGDANVSTDLEENIDVTVDPPSISVGPSVNGSTTTKKKVLKEEDLD